MSQCAASAISALDRQLARKGQTVVLARIDYDTDPAKVSVRGFCRGAKPDELAAGIVQFETSIIISPTGLAGWPAPPKLGDEVRFQGRTKTIVASTPIVIGDFVVRYDLRVQ